jgi:hypothetical protein
MDLAHLHGPKISRQNCNQETNIGHNNTNATQESTLNTTGENDEIVDNLGLTPPLGSVPIEETQQTTVEVSAWFSRCKMQDCLGNVGHFNHRWFFY